MSVAVRTLALAVGALAGACGSSAVSVSVTLEPPAKAQLSPYEGDSRVSYVRVGIDGTESFDEAFVDLDLAGRAATFDEYPEQRTVRVVASGLDDLGNVVAYGEAVAKLESDDVTMTVPFRRTLAYVTHRDICDGGCGPMEVCANPGDGHRCMPLLADADCGAAGCDDPVRPTGAICIRAQAGPRCALPYRGRAQGVHRMYAIDVSNKTIVDTIALPDPSLTAINVTPKGGEGVWVTLRHADGTTKAAFLSSSTHEWSTPFDVRPGAELVMGAPGQAHVVVAGGGFLAAHDGTSGARVREVPLGGRVLDGALGGLANDKALVVTSQTLSLFDLEVPEEAVAVNPGDLPGTSGVALSADGRFAYASSATDGSVAIYDLSLGSSLVLGGRFTVPVNNLVYSERGQMLLGILTSDPSVFVGAFSVTDQTGFPTQDAVGTLPLPSGMASGPGGARVVVVSAGTSTGTAGLTVVDPIAGDAPEGSTVAYLRDPAETYSEGGGTFRQRYRPDKVAALYGR